MHEDLGYGLTSEVTDVQGREGGAREHALTSCQTDRCFSTSSGRCSKLSGNISDKRMISSHPWSDSQAQGFFRLLFSREMFPNYNRSSVSSRHGRAGKRGELCTRASLALGNGPLERRGAQASHVTACDSRRPCSVASSLQAGQPSALTGCSESNQNRF